MTERPIAHWRGQERYGNELLESLTIIFKSGGCSWSKCRMCSYRHERYSGQQPADILSRYLSAQLSWVINHYDIEEYQMVKIFTSGSFFDPHEITPGFLYEVAKTFKGKLVIAESRPEFIETEVISRFIDTIDNGNWKIPLYCAIGLETSNDRIREKSINKGFTFPDFIKSAEISHSAGAGVKAYLLLKPLFLTESEAMIDMKISIREAMAYADIISMNPCTVQRNTELEYYWKRGAYRPPYLWSVLSLLADAPVHITCDPLGGGQKRGPHNCSKCDYEIVKAIRDYSLNADRDLIRTMLEIPCNCKKEWEYVLSSEKNYCLPLTR